MRALICIALLVACGPKVDPKSPALDDDLPAQRAEPVAVTAEPAVAVRPVAPAGKGLRTGTIDRAKLIAVLDHGPGEFLRQFEVTAHMDGERFVGWQLVQVLDHQGVLADLDVAPGDVLLALNGQPLSRPDQLQTVWDSLRTANEVVADLWRGNAKLQLRFAIEPKVAK
jgi:S1-C subfamily serine protease